MLQSVSFDQLRMFVAAADEGSFSAAARRVQRTQSAVSEAILNLEAQLGVVLFDRSGRYPKLTIEGAVLLAKIDHSLIHAGVGAVGNHRQREPRGSRADSRLSWRRSSTCSYRSKRSPNSRASFESSSPPRR